MGTYVDLVGGQGWLEGQAVLVPSREVFAESNACEKIDEELYAWASARALWTTPALTPPHVRRIALMLASAEYMTAGMVKGTSDAAIPTAARDLYARALLELEKIKQDGYIIGAGGEVLLPDEDAATAGAAGGTFPGVER